MEIPQRHFIGSIVTQPISDAPERAAKFMLIDGQQRMTTLLLLLAVVRFHAAGNSGDTSLATEIADTCLNNVHIGEQNEQFKLRPTLKDLEHFEKAMRGEAPDTGSQIGKAWAYFSRMVVENDRDGKPIVLRRIKERITLYLDLVSIRLEQEDSPNRIFESLNNTGVRLEASDLIRNYIFMRIPDEGRQKRTYEELWFPMQERLGSSIDDFFWRHSMMDGTLTRSDHVFDTTKNILSKRPDEEVIPALESFSDFSKYYMRIKEPLANEVDVEIKRRAIRLSRWEVDVSCPFLLVVYHEHATGRMSSQELAMVLQTIESFVVRRTICGVPTNRLRRIFAGMTAQCEHCDIVEWCRAYLLRNDWPDDDEFSQKLVEYPLYNPSRLN